MYAHVLGQRTDGIQPKMCIPTLEWQVEQKQGSCQYVNMPQRQKERKLSPIHKKHVKPDAQIQLEENPSYHTTQFSNIWVYGTAVWRLGSLLHTYVQNIIMCVYM